MKPVCRLAGAIALAGALVGSALAQSLPPIGVTITDPGGSNASTRVELGLNKSTVVELETPASDVVITNPAIADAVVQTSKRIIFRGVAIGQTNAIIFDASGRQLANLDLNVEFKTTELEALIEKHVPDARVEVESANGKMLVSGFVDNASQMDQVRELIALYAPAGKEDILNLVEISAKDQVLLRVKIVEMQRGVTKQLGINLTGTSVNDDITSSIGTVLGFNATGGSQGGLVGSASTVLNRVAGVPQLTLDASFSALERIGLSRTLAEPNIVAISGETGDFLAGGEFPIPVSVNDEGRLGIEFKRFGVSLAFTPVVLSEGRIHLKVSTEVSELSAQGSVNINGLTIPGLSTRRVTSAVEIPSGSSMMLAGLIQSTSRQGMDQLPGINEVPVLGALFQSRDFVNSETELVIVVTPYLVDPSQPSDLRSPDAGYSLASDMEAFLFGKLNDMYSRGERIDPAAYQAPVGFIEE